MFILQVTAKATIDLVIWVPIVAGLMAIIVNFLVIQKMKASSKEKLATKEYVNKEVKRMEVETDLKIEILKQANEETHTMLEYIRCRVDEIADRKTKK